MDDQLRKNLLEIIEMSNVSMEDKYALSARVPLLRSLREAYELKEELYDLKDEMRLRQAARKTVLVFTDLKVTEKEEKISDGASISESLIPAFDTELTFGRGPRGAHDTPESNKERVGVSKAHGQQTDEKRLDQGEIPPVTNPVQQNNIGNIGDPPNKGLKSATAVGYSYQKDDLPIAEQGWDIGISLTEVGTLVQRETFLPPPAAFGPFWAATGTGAAGSFADPEKAPNIKYWFMQAEIAQQSPASVPLRQIVSTPSARGRVRGGTHKRTRDKDRGPCRSGSNGKDNPDAMLPSRHC
jgi:hypothetical protein